MLGRGVFSICAGILCHCEEAIGRRGNPLLLALGFGTLSTGRYFRPLPLGPYFLVAEQESKQRSQLRGGFELFAPANKATSPKNPSRPALGVGI